ncbi:hypothetical protein FIBSPDRAFT_67208 [Athelia psychrophila]|uniref:Uncharacterized protein n=1 Tax=Athelia psychrophila TaxID=1759441 RepID=A0A166EUR5_9AGAM|nr:hypothetical protein FIBSPDRAFT_67208 [Fibularhizoctonia sp. CBS 109695]
MQVVATTAMITSTTIPTTAKTPATSPLCEKNLEDVLAVCHCAMKGQAHPLDTLLTAVDEGVGLFDADTNTVDVFGAVGVVTGTLVGGMLEDELLEDVEVDVDSGVELVLEDNEDDVEVTTTIDEDDEELKVEVDKGVELEEVVLIGIGELLLALVEVATLLLVEAAAVDSAGAELELVMIRINPKR